MTPERSGLRRATDVYTLSGMGAANGTREGNIILRVSDAERQLIRAVGDAQGLSMSDAIRLAVRHEAKRLGVAVGALKRRARKG